MFGLEGLQYQIPARGSRETYRRGTILPNLAPALAKPNDANNSTNVEAQEGFVYIQDKADGVEPGFLALKYGAPFFKQVKVHVLNLQNSRDSDQEGDDKRIQGLLLEVFKKNKKILMELYNEQRIKDIHNISDVMAKDLIFNLPDAKHAELFMAHPDIADYITGKIMLAFASEAKAESNETADPSEAKGEANETGDPSEKKPSLDHYKELFTKYFIKQDYNDPSWGDAKVSIPHYRAANTNKAKGFGIFRDVYAFFYRLARRRSRDEENLNAIREVLATEIARQWGAKTHNQALSFGTYLDGHPKLITISEWNNNVIPLTDQLKITTITGGSYRYGNYLATMDSTTGRYVSDQSISDLGEHLPLFIALADPDGIGSNGNNKLKIPRSDSDTQFDLFYIDMGQCLRGKNPLVGCLQDDFSITLPQLSPFKNLSIFSDTPLHERMKGIHILNKLRNDDAALPYEYDTAFQEKLQQIGTGADLRVFDNYIKKFKELAKENPSHSVKYKQYATEIETVKQHYLEATQAILAIFDKRIGLSPNELDLLDGIERLTSKRSINSPDGTVRLKRLRIEPGTRIAWQLSRPCQEKPCYSLTTTASSSEQAQAITTHIEHYLKFVDKDPNSISIKTDNETQITLSFTAANLTELLAIFSEPTLIKFTQSEQTASQMPSHDRSKFFTNNNIHQQKLQEHEKDIEQFSQTSVIDTSSTEKIELKAFELSQNLLDLQQRAFNITLIAKPLQDLLDRISDIKQKKIAELERHTKAINELQKLAKLVDTCCIFPDQDFAKAMQRLRAMEAKVTSFADQHDIMVLERGLYTTTNNPNSKPLRETINNIYLCLKERRNQVLVHHLPIGLLNSMANKSSDPLFVQWEHAYLTRNPTLKDFKLQFNNALLVWDKELSSLKDYKEVISAANNKDINPFKAFLGKHKALATLFYRYRLELNKANDDFMAYQKALSIKPRAIAQPSSSWHNSFSLFKAHPKPTVKPVAQSTGILATLLNMLRM